MNAIQIKDGIYWVGALDWHLRNFHGYTTNRGATYNAYLIIDEKVALIDTVKAPFSRELLERISSIIDPSRIDYIISNHVEMDHSGALPALMETCPNATVVTSAPSGVKGLTAHYGPHNYMAVKNNDTLSLGKRSLSFVTTPMLHWPDNMVTWCPEEKILFSNDAFGQHYCTNTRFDDDSDFCETMQEAKKYYANIIMCYGKQAAGAWKIVKEMEPEMIAPSHGVIWRSHVADILNAYEHWSSSVPEAGALIVFDSMWHSTETMAQTIAEAFTEKGEPVKLFDLKQTHISDIVVSLLDCKYVAVGSPTLNNNMLPTVAAFLCYMKGLSPKNRQAFSFGSYGWGGQANGQIEEALKKCGFDICLETLKIQYIPSEEQLKELSEKIKSLK